MANPPALQPGVAYHIFNRGNNRENLFVEERNYRYFLQLYAHYIEPVAYTYAYCLLRNHFHLLVRARPLGSSVQTPKVSQKVLRPSQQFSNLFNAYAKAFNQVYGRTGSLFEHPFERAIVDSDPYFRQVVIYIHRNPQKHGLVPDFRSWPFSSYNALLSTKPTHLRRDDVLAWFNGVQGFVAAHETDVDEERIKSLLLDE